MDETVEAWRRKAFKAAKGEDPAWDDWAKEKAPTKKDSERIYLRAEGWDEALRWAGAPEAKIRTAAIRLGVARLVLSKTRDDRDLAITMLAVALKK